MMVIRSKFPLFLGQQLCRLTRPHGRALVQKMTHPILLSPFTFRKLKVCKNFRMSGLQALCGRVALAGRL
jgi:hypothetical protein